MTQLCRPPCTPHNAQVRPPIDWEDGIYHDLTWWPPQDEWHRRGAGPIIDREIARKVAADCRLKACGQRRVPGRGAPGRLAPAASGSLQTGAARSGSAGGAARATFNITFPGDLDELSDYELAAIERTIAARVAAASAGVVVTEDVQVDFYAGSIVAIVNVLTPDLTPAEAYTRLDMVP